MEKKKILILISITLLIILLDQISKFVVEKNFKDQYVGNNIVGIEVTNNTGFAFGFNDGNFRNILLTAFVLGVIINFIVKQFNQIDLKTVIALSFVLGGGLGNFIDRFIRGSVLDFIKIYKFPNFNIADSFVVVGWLLIIIFLIIYTRREEKTGA